MPQAFAFGCFVWHEKSHLRGQESNCARRPGLGGLCVKEAESGFGILLLFVVFEFGFIIAAMSVAQPVLRALNWSAILVGNLLAAAAMTVYFWRRHPHMRIEP